MKVTKAYILRIDDSTSLKYADVAAKSCENVGIPYEFFDGFNGWTIEKLQKEIQWLTDKKIKKMNNRAACAGVGHLYIWKKILDNSECAIVLEHDGYMLHPLNIDVPDNLIVNLGYKFFDKEKYDHVKAGPPQKISNIKKHAGAHAYAITWKTAEILLNEVKEKGVWTDIDNAYFMRHIKDCSKVPCAITDPICGIGWLRNSTIWRKSALHNEKPLIDSFKNHFFGGKI